METPRRATIADIAARAGVSPGAVSFALNNRPGVSAATRARILEIAREMHWRPHSAARALGGARAGTVGFVLTRPARTLGTESFFGDLISGIQLGLTGSHVGMNLLVARDLEEELDTYQEWWNGHQVDGVVLIDPRTNDPRVDLLAKLGMPTVVIGSKPSPDGEAPTIWIDDRDAALTVYRYLHALGHRRIAHVAGRADFEHTGMRISALETFARTVGLDHAQSLTTDYSAAEGEHATRRLLSEPEPPTAIVYDNDVLAVAGLGVASEMGVPVPDRLSIISFDDSAMARLVRPSLTTLTRDTVELGERAARLLLDQIDAGKTLPSRRGPALTLSARDSTAPPPGG
ncbi:LacI family DNA-binding transcriptional regulator [uncultured Leifsonia sp.]|uniref:LacI family DNA-binding transcriptional regulator n=1 Tax=uncultured Leifsonia sp. TaxID=340359 RepID=UPI0028D436C7|nr:LacI family DNA-binding transcriptional regulator [uncultured Leifsonia sp.]